MNTQTPDAGTNTTLAQAMATTPVGVQLGGDIADDVEISLDGGDDISPAPAPAPATPEPSTVAPAPTPEPDKPAEPELSFETPGDEPEPAPTPAQPTPTPPDPNTQLPAQRDYSAYPPELHPVLRQLNNKAFAEFGPRLKAAHEAQIKAQELEQRVNQQPKFFYEHPEAFRLDPKFAELEQNAQLIAFEEQHWSNQLARIKRGEPWKELTHYDAKTGQPVYRDVPAPEDGTVDAQAEVEVFRLLNTAGQARILQRQELNNFVHQFRSQRTGAEAELANIRAKLFPSLKPETLEGVDKQNYELAAQITPEALRNHPLAQLNQLAFVAYHRLQRAYANLVAENKKLKGRAPVAATPAPSATPGAAPSGDDEMIPLTID